MAEKGTSEVKVSGQLLKVEVGVVAIFGVEYQDAIESLAYKMASLSQRRSQLKFSRMGEVIPNEPSNERIVGGRTWDELLLSFRDRILLDKVFLILYLETKSVDGNDVFAYVNVRTDRVQTLLRRGSEEKSYLIKDYATIVLQNYGKPSIDDLDKLRRDYLFDPDHVNVRIFPPLQEVT